jgi:hypothetical protein
MIRAGEGRSVGRHIETGSIVRYRDNDLAWQK